MAKEDDKDWKEIQNPTTDQIRKELESLLTNGDTLPDDAQRGPVVNGDEQGPLAKVQHPNTRNMDIYGEHGKITEESKKILASCMKFYLDAKIIRKDEYVKYKRQVDEMTLGNIIFVMKTTQHAIIKIMEEIDMGNMHPRIFEVLGQLQNTMLSAIKHQAAWMVTMEEGYRKIKDDHDRIQQQRAIEEAGPQDDVDMQEGQPVKSRGTKGLIAGIRDNIQDVNFEEIKDDKPRLTDPNNRPEDPTGMGRPLEEDHDDETFSVDDDMF